ncbi:hypothetical protein D3C76_1735580 [compost metagenome]
MRSAGLPGVAVSIWLVGSKASMVLKMAGVSMGSLLSKMIVALASMTAPVAAPTAALTEKFT